MIVAGLGKRDELDGEKARVAAAAAAARGPARSAPAPCPGPRRARDVAGALVEGTLLKLYTFDRFKSKKDDSDEGDNGIESLEISSPDADVAEVVSRARIGAEAQNRARDLQNLPGNVATPGSSPTARRAVADARRLEVRGLRARRDRGHGHGRASAVAQGTAVEPQLIVMRYEPAARRARSSRSWARP